MRGSQCGRRDRHSGTPAYRVAARLLAAELERSMLGEAGEPATKRPKLESVVPAPAPPPAKPVFKAPPPMPKQVAPPLWLSGQLPTSHKYSNSRDTGYGGNYGGGGGRGGGGHGGREAEAAAAAAAAANTSLCVEKSKIKRRESTSESPMIYLVNVEKVSS